MTLLTRLPLTLLLCAAPALALASDGPVWPAQVIQKDDPRLAAFYDAQCADYARRGLTGLDAEQFHAQCLKTIKAVFPAGLGSAGGGGE